MEMKNLKDSKKIPKYKQPNLNKRPLGSIQIDVPESVRRKTVSPAFLSIDSSVMEGDLSEKFIDLIDLDVSFKLSTFLEFFMYNFLFFFLFGPFSALIYYPFIRNFCRFRNMCFWGFNIIFFKQTLQFFFCVFGIFGYFYLDSPNIYAIEVIGMILSGFLLTCVIAAKYGYFSVKKCLYFKETNLEQSDLQSESYLDWCKQNEFTIDKELYTCILKNNIDSSTFRMWFLKPLKPSLAEQLAVPDYEFENPDSAKSSEFSNSGWLKEVWIKSFDVVKKTLFKKQLCEEGTYSGYLVARFLVKENRELSMSVKWIERIAWVIAIIETAIPTLFRIYEKGTVLGQNYKEILVISSLIGGKIYFTQQIFTMLIYGMFEYDRPIHLLSQLSNILSSQKVSEYYVKKVLPTINVFCPISYKSWYCMNRIFRTYGEKFLKRIEMVLGLFLFFNLVMALLCVLAVYNLLGPFGRSINIAYLGYGLILMLVAIFLALRKGAIINELYDIHRDILKNNKDIISDLLHLYSTYFELSESDSENEIYYYATSVFCKHTEGMSPEEKKKCITSFLNNLKEMNDDIIEQLAFSKERRPFKIFGIPATSALLKSILAGLGTAAIACIQKFLSSH